MKVGQQGKVEMPTQEDFEKLIAAVARELLKQHGLEAVKRWAESFKK